MPTLRPSAAPHSSLDEGGRPGFWQFRSAPRRSPENGNRCHAKRPTAETVPADQHCPGGTDRQAGLPQNLTERTTPYQPFGRCHRLNVLIDSV